MTDRHAHIAALTLVPVVALALSLGFLAGDRYRTLRCQEVITRLFDAGVFGQMLVRDYVAFVVCEGPQLAERVGASATFHDGTNSGTNQ